MASAVPNVAPAYNLSGYLREISRFPMLTSAEEVAYARRWRDCEDVELPRTSSSPLTCGSW